MTKDLNDSDSVASANDNPAQDEDFKGSDAEISPESASEADSTKVKKSPKKSPKKKASKKSKKTNKKSPAKKSPAKRKSVTIVEKDPLSNSDDEQAAEDEAGEAEEEYEVEAIVGHREYNAKLVYKIRWKGYGASSDTWEAADSLSCPNLLEAYNFKV